MNNKNNSFQSQPKNNTNNNNKNNNNNNRIQQPSHLHKDIKTCLNLDTRLQQQRQRPDNVDASGGVSVVQALSSRFDTAVESGESEEEDTDLRRKLAEQRKRISNLRDQVEAREKRLQEVERERKKENKEKDRKIRELESRLKLLSRHIPPDGLDLSSVELSGQSLA